MFYCSKFSVYCIYGWRTLRRRKLIYKCFVFWIHLIRTQNFIILTVLVLPPVQSQIKNCTEQYRVLSYIYIYINCLLFKVVEFKEYLKIIFDFSAELRDLRLRFRDEI